MPGSTFSGGGVGIGSNSVRQGINNAEDVDSLLTIAQSILNKLGSLQVETALNALELRPVVISEANAVASSGTIESPGVGKQLIVQVAGWYSATPQNAFLTIKGTDNKVYLKMPITSSGAGFTAKIKIPTNVGCVIELSPGGANVHGYLNISTAVREV